MTRWSTRRGLDLRSETAAIRWLRPVGEQGGLRVERPPGARQRLRAGRVLRALRADPEAGQISILLIGMVTVTLMIVLGVVGVTSVQLSRIHLLDAADAAALDASDALAEQQAYAEGVGGGLPVTDATVTEAATAYLASRPMPSRISGWSVAGAGAPDGRTAVVTVSGTARIPVVTPVLAAFGGGVEIAVTSTARSDLGP